MLPKFSLISSPQQPVIRRLGILGSTGSIGTQTLDIVRLFPDRLSVSVLTAGRNADLLIEQALTFKPKLVVIADESAYAKVNEALQYTGIEVAAGSEALNAAASHAEVDVVVAAMVGFAGLAPTVAAIQAGKTIALANKETLVVAGELMSKLAKAANVAVLPVDSEHAAIFQCLVGESAQTVDHLVLTASGGPFRTREKSTFSRITKAEALHHPNWNMGAKITIDSATMMNKGLEVIEARWLFDVPQTQIKVLVHPQSIIHSMVQFSDGSLKAQLGVPDMKVPIQYALTFPDRWAAPHDRIDWATLRQLDFEPPDWERFPALRLAFDALEMGGVATAIMNAANEEAVALFLEDRIHFTEIPILVEQAMDRMPNLVQADLNTLASVDHEARTTVRELRRASLHSITH